jgi:hypothetical protein
MIFPLMAMAEMGSQNFKVRQDVLGNEGGQGTSQNFKIYDTMGEAAIGPSSGVQYKSNAGFWQTINYAIAINCDGSLAMGVINGTGRSATAGNVINCNVSTDNPAGYNFYWKASSTNMVSGSDTIGSYTPGTPDMPETWLVANNVSAWGGKLGSASSAYNSSDWGADDTYAGGKWLNVSTSDRLLIGRSGATSYSGDNQKIVFGAEVGSNVVQPSGTYTVNVTITALSL